MNEEAAAFIMTVVIISCFIYIIIVSNHELNEFKKVNKNLQKIEHIMENKK